MKKIFAANVQIIFVSLTEVITLEKKRGKEVIEHPTARQCYYCDNFFSRKDSFETHVKTYSSITGIAYKFNNRKIESFQKNHHFMGDLPFTVCFDSETTSGDSVLLDKIMYVISCCQVYTFHPKLKLPKIVVFRIFQQHYDEITSLDHLSQEHIPYFDQLQCLK